MPLDFINMLELYYYGHLFNLLQIRLKAIRVLLVSSYSHKNNRYFYSEHESINFSDKNNFMLRDRIANVEILSLLLMYCKIVKAYDFLNAAIKWQLLIIVTTSFVTLVGMAYRSALSYIENNFTWFNGLPDAALMLIRVLPLIEPCVCAEGVHIEVILLRTSLYSRVYNNIFDCNNRKFANTLIALTQARSLSFSVFRMMEINTTLPFKFLGLLITYLVILLQFYKVINLDRRDL
ncbi:uncharacterized protein [Battus philenor]|uniref:uncharacterized protein n=1 Tax=Battus philenor TaxID=42288 RepID=UPI0035CF7FD5